MTTSSHTPSRMRPFLAETLQSMRAEHGLDQAKLNTAMTEFLDDVAQTIGQVIGLSATSPFEVVGRFTLLLSDAALDAIDTKDDTPKGVAP